MVLNTYTSMVGCSAQSKTYPSQRQEAALLLHGMGRTSVSMRKLHRRLEQNGYWVINWNYKSRRHRIEYHGQRLHKFLVTLDDEPTVSKIHMVSHSLGGVIVRHALTVGVPEKIGRVVMLAPPNRGSAAAMRLAPLLGKIIIPLTQLSNDPNSFVNQLAVPENVEFGVIAAKSDGKVRPEETHLPGEADHLIVPGYHTFIMKRDDVCNEVLAFIKHGRFNKRTTDTQP